MPPTWELIECQKYQDWLDSRNLHQTFFMNCFSKLDQNGSQEAELVMDRLKLSFTKKQNEHEVNFVPRLFYYQRGWLSFSPFVYESCYDEVTSIFDLSSCLT